tara:strand:- start:93 stop:281 length:189 start_codon:yes stop_codon:yes gene_type:complete
MTNLMIQGLQKLFDDLENTSDHIYHAYRMEREALKYKESIRELCEQNEQLKHRLWKYEEGEK